MKKFILLVLLIFISFNTNAQTNVSGAISSDTTWRLADSPYIVTGNILVTSGVTLTIEDGVTVKVNSGLYIKIDGKITAVGTSNSFIIFESNALSQAVSDWDGIRIRPTGGSSIDGSQNYNSGSQFKYVKIRNANRGIYILGTGLHISYCEFSANNKAMEIRTTKDVVIDNCSFTSNTYGIWSEYEDYISGDNVGTIENTYVQNNTFSTNSTGISLNMNQRDFVNLNINNNLINDNTIGVNFGGGGYGPRVHSVNVYNNIVKNSTQYGIIFGHIYGASSGNPTWPVQVFKNKLINNGVFLDLQGGSSGVPIKIKNNIGISV